MSADASRSRPHPAPGDPGLAKGASIGRYVVLSLIGRGGMGEVYAAYDPDLDRKIAVKLLRARGSGLSGDDGRTRLLREAQAIARLSHPNVVVVYDVGTFNESVFIAMEFVEGHTLGYWLQAEKRRWREVLQVFLAAGQGLVAAHAAGLVHRDFKPDNVMLTKAGQVRVMDFGLARELEPGRPASTTRRPSDPPARLAAHAETLAAELDRDATAKLDGGQDGGNSSGSEHSSSGGYLRVKLTQTGAILGTPAYMAPEQFEGTGGDARADQFAFCVALYEGLYGTRPFAGDSAMALITNVITGTVTEPPADSKVPAWIRKIILRGLSTNPDDRFPSMTELLAALARDPAGSRRRWTAAAAGVLFVAGVAVAGQRISAGQRALCAGGPKRAATVWTSAQGRAIARAFEATHSKHAAQASAGALRLIGDYVARWTAQYQEACEATQVRGEQSAEVLDLRMACLGERLSSVRALTDVLASADASVVDNAVSAAAALPGLDRCADVQALRAVIRPPGNPETRKQVERLREQIAQVRALASAGLCDRAKKIGDPVLEAANHLGYQPVQAEISHALGLLFDTCLDVKEGIEHLEDAVMAAEAAHYDEIAIEASAMLGGAYADRTGDVREGRRWIRHAEAILARFPGHRLLEARVAVSREIVLQREGRLEEALAEVQRARAIQEAILGARSVEVAMAENNIATVLHELGRDQEAVESIRRALDIFAGVLGRDGGRFAIALLNESEILTALGRFAEAEGALRRAEDVWKQGQGSAFLSGVAALYEGRLRLAERNARAARTLLEKSLADMAGQDPLLAAEGKFLLARALLATSPAARDRATTLARAAHETLAADPAARRLLRDVEAWQDENHAR